MIVSKIIFLDLHQVTRLRGSSFTTKLK